ncbi:MAG: hypothetical protein ACREK2_07645 [Gemmatimonadota bacterium]
MRSHIRPVRILACALFLAPVSVEAQETLWPASRSSHSMVWHAGLGQVVLLGGGRDDSRAKWMWGWDGIHWSVLDTLGPGDRAHFGFAYDSSRDRLVQQGGFSFPASPDTEPVRHGETWEWDGERWGLAAEDGPGVRDHTAMAYDPERKVVVLFGGSRPDQTLLGDTWSWDGASWSEMDAAGPPARATHRLVWDDRRKALVLFGGWGADGLLADTWTWDGSRWSALADSVAGPAPRFATRIAFDEARGEIVLYGGRGESDDFADTWIWNDSSWSEREVVGPGPLNVHEMAYDPRRERVVLFGGFHAGETYADLWEWDGEAWEQMLPD